MALTKNQKKFANKADQKIRKAGKELEGARKDLQIVFKEDSNSDKIRRQEIADSDEFKDETKSKQT